MHVLFAFLKLFQNNYGDCSNCSNGWKKLIVPNLSRQAGHMLVSRHCGLRPFPHRMVGPLGICALIDLAEASLKYWIWASAGQLNHALLVGQALPEAQTAVFVRW